MGRTFELLTPIETRWIAEQLDRADKFVGRYGHGNLEGRSTLEELDRAFVGYLASSSDPSDANAVVLAIGAALGSRLVDDLGFRWVIATDDYGTDLAVLARPGRGDVTIFPAEFIAKRYERREVPFLVDAVAEIRHHLEEIASEWGDVDSAS